VSRPDPPLLVAAQREVQVVDDAGAPDVAGDFVAVEARGVHEVLVLTVGGGLVAEVMDDAALDFVARRGHGMPAMVVRDHRLPTTLQDVAWMWKPRHIPTNRKIQRRAIQGL
jgi:hypothetical protein